MRERLPQHDAKGRAWETTTVSGRLLPTDASTCGGVGDGGHDSRGLVGGATAVAGGRACLCSHARHLDGHIPLLRPLTLDDDGGGGKGAHDHHGAAHDHPHNDAHTGAGGGLLLRDKGAHTAATKGQRSHRALPY